MERLIVADRTEVLIDKNNEIDLLPVRPERRRVAILTQPAATAIALRAASQLQADGLLVEVVGLPDRDQAKTLKVATAVYETLARFGLARGDTIMGVGGGSVTDLAGFVAGTWLRGVEAVHMPTTLLGSIDASIGGKTGVNLVGKNLVGVLWHPTRVLVDTSIMDDLPLSLRREGMAEAFKAGLVGDSELCELISTEGLNAETRQVVLKAISVKARIVTQDDQERNVRAYLNFGHTIGHAVEYASTLSHGESVGLGMVAASAVSRDLLGFSDFEKVKDTVELLGLPTHAESINGPRVRDLLRHDKKREGDRLRMVLLSDIEKPELRFVDHTDLEMGLASLGL